ncbi:SDR family oxidoreductase [Sphingobium sp. LB126]|uniref:SDR family oxidoreductase n=1 Tax=Sphingobium sp. LB126 TaxID=1983755 RepID=UPI0018D599D0|nr:SDR family oxidoreductase [Sphingobium sp. LB126]
MDMKIKPSVLVTGGNRGLGRSIVLLAAARGWNIAFSYRQNRAEAEAVVEAAVETGVEAIAIQADTADRSAVFALVDQVRAAFGRLDGVVANAGVGGAPRSIEDVDEDHLDEVFRINVLGVMYTVGAATRAMSKLHGGNGGSIVLMSSAAARHGGMVREAHYAASKGAIDSLNHALAKELPPHGIRINTLRPGLIRTAIHDIHGGEELIAKVEPGIPLGRAGEADEVAEAALFLLEDRSSYVHGAILDVSGGR